MSNSKYNHMVLPTNQIGIEGETNRIYCMLYLVYNKKEYYVYVSCSNIKEGEPQELSVEFMNSSNYNTELVGYNTELFDDIVKQSVTIMSELKTNRKVC